MAPPGLFGRRKKDQPDTGEPADTTKSPVADSNDVPVFSSDDGGDLDDRTDPLLNSVANDGSENGKSTWKSINMSMAGRIEEACIPPDSFTTRWVTGNIDDDRIKTLKERLQEIDTPLVPVGEYTTVENRFAVIMACRLVPMNTYRFADSVRPCEVLQLVFDLLNGLLTLKVEAGLMPASFDYDRLFVTPVPIGVAENGLTWRVKYALLHELTPVEENDLDDDLIRQALSVGLKLLERCDSRWHLKPATILRNLFSEILARKDSLFASVVIEELIPKIGFVHGAIDTNVGRIRTSNEDNAKIAIENTTRPGASLVQCWVADGMGGHAAGEIASNIAISTLERILSDWRGSALTGNSVIESHLERAFLRANADIFADADLHTKRAGMGTTLTGILAMTPFPPVAPGERVSPSFETGRAWCANIGDSRTYLVLSTKLLRLSHDHSFVQQLIDKGSVTEEEAFKHPAKNVISKCLGADRSTPAEPDVCTLTCGCGDLFLSASDGLTDLLTDEEIFGIVREEYTDEYNLHRICTALIDAANDKGGKDNITVAFVYFS